MGNENHCTQSSPETPSQAQEGEEEGALTLFHGVGSDSQDIRRLSLCSDMQETRIRYLRGVTAYLHWHIGIEPAFIHSHNLTQSMSCICASSVLL